MRNSNDNSQIKQLKYTKNSNLERKVKLYERL